MEQYKTNQFMSINDKFLLIENHFMVLSNSPRKKMFKLNSHLNLLKRPALKNKKKIFINKSNIRNPLDQIGNDDLIFNNDKLITNINIDDAFDGISSNDDNSKKGKNSDSMKRNLTPVREGRKKINIKKLDLNQNNKEINENDTLQLNFNKSPKNRRGNVKLNNYKNIRSKKNYFQKYKLKSINQFINKPNDEEINNQKNISKTTTNKTKKKLYHNSFNRLNNLKLTITHGDNDSISLASTSKIGTKTKTKPRGKSVQNTLKRKSNMHFPNKSVIKNKDKLLIELKKIFGDKIILCDDIYQNMNEIDKKNCINFLLEAIKEMININKMIESKNEGFKSINEAKEKQIKDDKNEIKELKKNIIKLNKIIKTNIQINRKLSQNVDNLKIQLEKEKNKNKNNEINKRGKSSCKNFNNIFELKNKNESNNFAITTTKRSRYKSQERFMNTNDFINKKKKLDFNKNKDKDKDNSEINDNKGKNTINLNKIKIEEKNILSDTIKENTENLNENKNISNIEDKNNLNEKISENSEKIVNEQNDLDKNMNNELLMSEKILN